jgi:flavin reductase (DIM6/NTAB) family NADH-FMN oxidoreductase RutF
MRGGRDLKIDPPNFEGFNRVLTGVVVPRPIAFVSSMSAAGLVNLAPFSFFNAVAYDPPTIVFSSSRHAGDKRKDTLANIEETGEFVVNVVVDAIAEAMNRTAAEYPTEVNEFAIAGLTPVPSDVVRPPRVAESPANMECRLNQVVPIGQGRHQHGLVIGEIVLLHIRDDIIQGHRINHQKLQPTGRLAGNMYCHTADVFEMVRPVYTAEPEVMPGR